MRRALLLASLLVVVVACGDDDADDDAVAATTTTTTEDRPTTTATSAPDEAGDVAVSLDAVAVRFTEVARVDQPTDLAVRPGDDSLYLAGKGGLVHRVPAAGEPESVLDLTADVSTGGEQGLLGITFSPDGERFYAHFTNTDGDTRVEEWSADFDPASRRTVLEVDQPYGNHNGGRLTFGPDGLLYLGLGDGGAGGDPHGNGQNPSALLGKILRWDPVRGGEPERWAIGLRNPWRFSFDRATGDVWIGDVGQGAWEEIDVIPAGTPAGVNLGWDRFEGTHEHEGGGDRAGLLFPVFEYGHDEGRSVVGGFVYRGAHRPWHGVYFFADTYTARLRALLRGNGNGDVQHRDLQRPIPGGLVSSFGEDAAGELYVLSLDGGVHRLDPA